MEIFALLGFTQHRSLVCYRRFGTNYRSHLQRLLDSREWDRWVVSKRRVPNYRHTLRKSQNIEDFIYCTGEAWNRECDIGMI